MIDLLITNQNRFFLNKYFCWEKLSAFSYCRTSSILHIIDIRSLNWQNFILMTYSLTKIVFLAKMRDWRNLFSEQIQVCNIYTRLLFVQAHGRYIKSNTWYAHDRIEFAHIQKNFKWTICYFINLYLLFT